MEKVCKHCGSLFCCNPRVKNQSYCSHPECQRARKRDWQRRKMATDQDYRENQAAAVRRWREKHPNYWRKYRDGHPAYTRRNRLLQTERDLRKRSIAKLPRPVLAKMDAKSGEFGVISGKYRLTPLSGGGIAKMDALTVQLSVL